MEEKRQVQDKHDPYSSKSLLHKERIILDALKVRISELEQIRGKVPYELEKLKNMSE
jgi:hypothetical protein